MKKLIVGVTLVLAAAGFAAGPGKADKGVRGPHAGLEMANDPVVRMVTNPKVAEKIGLSEEQRKQIREIEKTNRDGLGDLRKRHREAMERQAGLLKAEKIDESAVMLEIDKTFEIRKEIAKRQMKRVIAIKSILTPEQVAKALEAFESCPKRGEKAGAKKPAAAAQPVKKQQ